MVAVVVGLTFLLILILQDRDCAVTFDDFSEHVKMAATYQIVPPDAFNFSRPSDSLHTTHEVLEAQTDSRLNWIGI